MEHNLITVEKGSALQMMIINHQDFNIDRLDNLADIPASPAVYAICGRVNTSPANPRVVGETENLQQTIRECFSGKASACLTTFMQSIKIKVLLFELMDDKTSVERVEKRSLWEGMFKPECNEALNKIH